MNSCCRMKITKSVFVYTTVEKATNQINSERQQHILDGESHDQWHTIFNLTSTTEGLVFAAGHLLQLSLFGCFSVCGRVA